MGEAAKKGRGDYPSIQEMRLVVSQLQMLHHQDTKSTKFHKEKQDVNIVFLGETWCLGGEVFILFSP